MSTCLIIDCSSRWLIVGVSGDGLAEEVGPAARQASTTLVSTLKRVLARASVVRPDWIVALRGPGSFTGARIGVSTARNLAQLWNIPVLGIDSTAAYAHSCLGSHPHLDEVCIHVDGKQKRVYARRLLRSRALEMIQSEPPLDLPPEEVLAKYPNAHHFVDDEQSIRGYLDSEGQVPLFPLPPPSIAHITELALLLGGIEAAGVHDSLVPLYLRDDPAHVKFPQGFPSQGTV